jgi:hypothetical protein
MPCENMSLNECQQSYIGVINEIEMLLGNELYSHVILAGDWNTDFKRSTAQVKELKSFLSRNNLILSCDTKDDRFTYVNYSLSQFSCIDHIFVSSNVFHTITSHNLLNDPLNPSNHTPISIEISFHIHEYITSYNTDSSQKYIKKVLWDKVEKCHVDCYKAKLSTLLGNMFLNSESLLCMNVHCKNQCHKNYINMLCHDIVLCCIQASDECFPHINTNGKSQAKSIPYWHEVIEPLKESSLMWHHIWVECGKPRHGVVYDVMRNARNKYHSTIKKIRKDEILIKKNRLVDANQTNKRTFWNSVKNINKCGKISKPNAMDGVSGDQNM